MQNVLQYGKAIQQKNFIEKVIERYIDQNSKGNLNAQSKENMDFKII